MADKTADKTNKDKKTKDIVKKVIDYMIPVAISAGLILWLFHKVHFKEIRHVLSEGVDFRWIFLMMAIIILSHVIRGIRWGIQLRGAGVPRLPVVTEAVSIFGAYALNLIFSYLGEAWRCVYISRITKTKLTTVIGTDIGDRLSDAVVVVMLTVLALVVARPAMDSFLDHYEFGRDLTNAFTSVGLWLWVITILAVIAGSCWFFRKTSFFLKIKAGFMRIWQGFAVLFHMKGIGLYILLTLGIWICYFMETYVCFQAFPFTKELVTEHGMAWGLLPGLVVFVFGSCSIAIPSSGGLGPWNIAVMFALSLYGIPQAEGAAYSLVVWSFTTLTLVIIGVFSAVYVALQRRAIRKLPADASRSQIADTTW